MPDKDSFWKGVLQNAIGSLMAGLLLLGLGRAWVGSHFDGVLDTLRTGLNQVASLQTQMNRIEQTPAKPVAKKVKHHTKKRRHRTGEARTN